jgi:hypothetical protein
MTQDEITKIAEEAGWSKEYLAIGDERLERFAKLVAEAERKVMQAKIETLYAMYELVTKQRDYLMDQQSAQVAAMRGRVQ